MPSEKVLEQKKQIVADVAAKLEKACAGVVVDYKGINVADDTALRKELREAGVDYFVIKNTMLKRAAEQCNLEGLDAHLEGTTAIGLHETDYVATARILNKFAEDHENFSLKTGFYDGKIIDLDELKHLATLPSKEELVAKALYCINYPVTGLVCVLDAIAKKQAEAEA